MSARHRDYFNSISAEWDKRQYNCDSLGEIVSRTSLQSGMRVLDMGAGTGCMSHLLINTVGRKGQVVALDIAEKMLARASLKPELAHIQFVCSDASHLPVPSVYFDAAVCFAVFPHFTQKKTVLAEIYRILKPGGNIYISHLMGSSEMNKHHSSIGGVVGQDVLPNGEGLAQMLFEAEFQVKTIIDQPELYFVSAMKY
jgi:ubiquinone/menaquinone biosynthesis C-methylase UbiE